AQRLEELGKHPQIPELMAYFTYDNRQYLVQEFVKGETLQTELDNNGVFSEQQIKKLLIEVLQILDFVHSKQVIHRDIKPENIILSSDKKLFLVDFGAAKIVKPQQRTATGTIIGSAEYCAPEQSMGKPLFISDLYSLGVTCLHLLTGVSPFDLYSPMEGEWVWRDFLNGNVVSNELGKILEKLASPIAKHRYQSVKEVINDLIPVNQLSTTQQTVKIHQPLVAITSHYQKLEKLLAEGKWKEADEETARVMLAVANREKEGFLDAPSIDNFPCDDLYNIDRLWLKYSNGKFGFSVQKQIYQSLGGTRKYDEKIWIAFGDRLGWRKLEKWKYYNDITFDIKAPEGHLPARFWDDWDWKGVGGGSRCVGRMSSFASRLVDCKI
ncbi:MAG: protein kinase, partial [Nostocales cyanobacterium]